MSALTRNTAAESAMLYAPVADRHIQLHASDAGEHLCIVAPDGQVELSIRLTADGPVLSLAAARLELKAAEAVRMECGTFEVAARDGVYLRAREMRVRTVDDVHLNGAYIRLNSPDGQPDTPVEPAPESGGAP